MTDSVFKIAVLISGRGSNLESLLKKQGLYSVGLIVSDNPDAPGLKYGSLYNVTTKIINKAEFALKKDFQEALKQTLLKGNFDLIALAGFMQIINKDLIETFAGKMINIHPSLLPKFPGLDTHKRALEAGVKQHGCTVHFVDNGVDTGPVIAQSELEISPDETEESLASKVLAYEHRLYPWVVEEIAKGNIRLVNNKVEFADNI